MGLDIGQAQWSYARFAKFRQELAEFEGIDISEMRGYGGSTPWEQHPTELRPLLDHSDCDGHLAPDECAQVAGRLQQLVPSLSDEYDRTNGDVLVREMLHAARRGELLPFR